MIQDARFLLYIDILGFADMTRRQPRKVARIYSILDSLNVHRHSTFKTIVFSDTVLVYNPTLAATDEERDYIVWYLIEFAEDLHHRLTGQDIFFRAVITTGTFAHYPLKNIECFFGEALVKAYLHEKSIPSIGLFIDGACNRHNRYFRTEPFADDLNFVYLNRSLELINQYTQGTFPFNDPALEDQGIYVPWQVNFLKDVHLHMRVHPDPAVRTKFLTAWDFYQRRYPAMTQVLSQSGFSPSALAGRPAWIDETAEMQQSIKFYKRIGSGTKLSMQVSASTPNLGRKRTK